MPNSLLLHEDDLNSPSFNLVPAPIAKLLTVWMRTSERGRTIGATLKKKNFLTLLQNSNLPTLS